MVIVDKKKQQRQAHRPPLAAWWRQALFLSIIGFGLFLLLKPAAQYQDSLATSGPSQRAPESALPPSNTQRSAAFNAGDLQFTWNRSLPTPVATDDWPNERQGESSTPPLETERRSWELYALVSKVKNLKTITAEGASYILRMLHTLRKQGAEAVPAIHDFLRQGDDVNFTKMSSGELIGYQTLRQALIDTLQKIGGGEALATSLEQIHQTRDPIELAMLARGLEKEEPGAHREEVIQAISNVLQWAEQALAKEPLDVSPLFALLRTYGGENAVAVLERSTPQWGEYALIALAGLPRGAGIQSLITLAGPSRTFVENPVLPFQTLAQASARYSEAGDALVNFARTGQIPDRAWSVIGEALEGKQLQLSSKMFDGTPLAEENGGGLSEEDPLWRTYYIEWLNVRYEQRVVSGNWSTAQLRRQVNLIDNLLSVTSNQTAIAALHQARAALQNNNR